MLCHSSDDTRRYHLKLLVTYKRWMSDLFLDILIMYSSNFLILYMVMDGVAWIHFCWSVYMICRSHIYLSTWYCKPVLMLVFVCYRITFLNVDLPSNIISSKHFLPNTREYILTVLVYENIMALRKINRLSRKCSESILH